MWHHPITKHLIHSVGCSANDVTYSLSKPWWEGYGWWVQLGRRMHKQRHKSEWEWKIWSDNETAIILTTSNFCSRLKTVAPPLCLIQHFPPRPSFPTSYQFRLPRRSWQKSSARIPTKCCDKIKLVLDNLEQILKYWPGFFFTKLRAVNKYQVIKDLGQPLLIVWPNGTTKSKIQLTHGKLKTDGLIEKIESNKVKWQCQFTQNQMKNAISKSFLLDLVSRLLTSFRNLGKEHNGANPRPRCSSIKLRH